MYNSSIGITLWLLVLVVILGTSLCVVLIHPEKIKKLLKKPGQAKFTVFKCKWFSIIKDGHYYYVDYKTEHAGVVIVAIVDETHILFVKNYRFPLKQDSWELPRGFIDKDENFTQAALRELIEETAYKGKENNCSHLGFIAPDSSILHNTMPVIKVCLSSEDKTTQELDPEISEAVKVPLSELNDWMFYNQVIDGITLASLMKYRMNKQS